MYIEAKNSRNKSKFHPKGGVEQTLKGPKEEERVNRRKGGKRGIMKGRKGGAD